eukprot:SAG22_NODE_10007_length_559_cov_0.617391_1_plen_85_part_00
MRSRAHLLLLRPLAVSASVAGITAGPPLAGALIDATDSYVLSGSLAAAFQLCAVATLCLLPRPEAWEATRATIRAGLQPSPTQP